MIGGPAADPELLTDRPVGDLELAIVRLPPGWPRIERRPSATPMEPGDPLPWLPEELAPWRVGRMFAAMDERGETRVTWHRRPVAPGQALHIVWREEDGPAPELHEVRLSGRPAVWFRCGHDGGWAVVCRGTTAVVVVTGRLPLDAVFRIAACLAPA